MADGRFQFSTRRWIVAVSCAALPFAVFRSTEPENIVVNFVICAAIFGLALVTKTNQIAQLCKQVLAGFGFGIVGAVICSVPGFFLGFAFGFLLAGPDGELDTNQTDANDPSGKA